MAIAPLTTATKPITTKGLYDAAGTGTSYEDWQKTAKPDSAMPSIAPSQVDDSVANKVTALTKQDSPLMQAAQTEGLKIANRRGLLNSSIAAGASTGAALDRALPIASQDASQDFQRNQGARAFEYGMASQDSAQASSEGIAKAQRELEEKMQGTALAAADKQQIRDIASREGIAAAERALQTQMQQTEINYQTGQRALDRNLQQTLASWNLRSSDRNAAAQMLTNMESMYQQSYQSIMANTALKSKDRSAQLNSAKNLRDRQLSLVEQMYAIDLSW